VSTRCTIIFSERDSDDAEIRRRLIERFPATGGGSIPQIGTKAQPGPLYGVSGHCWQALSVVVTGLEGIK
jgi:hypothetical protein